MSKSKERSIVIGASCVGIVFKYVIDRAIHFPSKSMSGKRVSTNNNAHTRQNNVKFENYAARCLESLIVPVATAKNNPTISSTSTLEQHLPCSFCMIVVERDNPEPLHFDIYTGTDCMERFVTKIEKLAKIFYQQKRKFPCFLGTAPPRDTWSKCWICNVDFNNDNEKVFHFNGKFIGYAHSACKLNRRTLNYTPVIAHNIMNYDLHHIVKSLHSASQSAKIEVIPTNDEKLLHSISAFLLKHENASVMNLQCTSTFVLWKASSSCLVA